MALNFTVEALASGTSARAATLETQRVKVNTPIFMPVGTQATVKMVNSNELEEAGASILLANTYHLLLRPGPEVFKAMGGIHKFMNWPGAVLTDSGGFQIFSLPHSRKMEEGGAIFKSYVDGKLLTLSPESSIEIQEAIGSDIMMVLDECVPSTAPRSLVQSAMDRTHRWALRSLRAKTSEHASLFGIVQGAVDPELRRVSANELTQHPFDGFAIGGLAVGETKAEREDFTELVANLLPSDKPRYLMGVGTPIDLLEAVHRGVDMFDCIIPTAYAQQSTAFTSLGELRLDRSVYKWKDETLDPACRCTTCRDYSVAYLHHLFKAKEPLGPRLLAIHNLVFYQDLMRSMREAIVQDTFAEFYRRKQKELVQKDPNHPPAPPKARKTKVTLHQELGDYKVDHSKEFATIVHTPSGERMHSVVNPDREAEELYVEQACLETLLAKTQEGPLKIWDVGLGGGHNAMAFLRSYESLAASSECRPLEMTSFELDLDSFRLTTKNPIAFRHVRHPAPHHLLEKGHWESGDHSVHWRLVTGDFCQEYKHHAPPHIMLFDPFSFKVNPEFWQEGFFKKLFEHCEGQATTLMTYSASTSVRAGLLSAGFYVAKGRSTGPKSETTIALTPEAVDDSTPLLSHEWLNRWKRSHAQFPVDVSGTDRQAQFESRILSHPQF